MYSLKNEIAHKSNYGSQRNTGNIKYVVIHYTGNDGDTADANANYFKGANRQASAHYFVDDNNVVCSVPDDYVAWSVGGAKYNDCWSTGGGSRYGQANNSNSISIEMCDTSRDGVVYPSDATINNAVELSATKMIQYGIPIENLIRHFDVNGKHCPAYACMTENGNVFWFFFVIMVQNKINEILAGGSVQPQPQPMPVPEPQLPSEIDWKAIKKFVIACGQQEANNFVGHDQIAVDGIVGQQSKRMKVRVLQHAMNLDYNSGLVEDGIWGNATERALGNHYIKYGERQQMVKAMQIIALINGVNPNGVDGVFGDETKNAFNTDFVNRDCIKFCTLI